MSQEPLTAIQTLGYSARMRSIRMRVSLILAVLVVSALACTIKGGSGDGPTRLPPPTSGPAATLPSSTIPPPALPTVTPAPPTPQSPDSQLDAADHALFNGDLDSARSTYQQAMDAAAARGETEIQAAAKLGLGKVEYLHGNYHNTLIILRELVEQFPNADATPDAYFILGQTYEILDRFVEAADAYLNYLALRPGMIDAYMYELRGDNLFAAADYGAALSDYLAAYNSPRLNDTLSLEIKIARTYGITGDIPTALVMYDDLYQRTEDGYTKAQINYLRGLAHASIGEIDQAQAYYLDSVSHFPEAYSSYLGLIELVDAGYPVDELQRGIVDYYAGEYAVAILAFERYLAAEPADPATARYFMGMSEYNLANYDAAITDWDVVIEGFGNNPYWDESWEMKAYTQWALLDDFEGGKQTLIDFVAARAEHPRSAEFLFDAARVSELSGDLVGAIYLWERLAANYTATSYNYLALFQKGLAYYRLGNFNAARESFVQAYQYAPTVGDQAANYLWIGKTYQAEGDNESARSAWGHAASIDPTGYYSERARDLLTSRDPFTPPTNIQLGIDWDAERQDAEAWLRQTFLLDTSINLSEPGELATDPRWIRGDEYLRLGLTEMAVAEFESLRQAVSDKPADSYRLMNHLYGIGLYRTAIFTARQILTLAGMGDAETLGAPKLFNHIRFGTYFGDLVIPIAEETNFHPLFVWSVMRQESLFDPAIGSPAGARGLMQIMPQTGESLASQFNWPANYSSESLYRPLVSTRLGLGYLDQQRQYFNGDLYTALAAYNGGPGNAAVWNGLARTGNDPNGDPDLFLEVIRYPETQRYIRSIYEIFSIYSQIYEQLP